MAGRQPKPRWRSWPPGRSRAGPRPRSRPTGLSSAGLLCRQHDNSPKARARFMNPGRSLLARCGDRLGRPAPSRAWDGELGGALMMADAAAGAGVERAQRRRQAQMQQPTTTMTNKMMKAAPAMLKAQLDIEVPEFNWVRYWSSERSG